jgi:hypothetical protein
MAKHRTKTQTAIVSTMADSNSDKAINVSDSIDIKSTHQGRSNDTMEFEDEAELMMIDSTTLVLSSCSTVNSTIGTTDRPTWIKTLSHGSRVQASPKHQQSPSLYRYDLLAMVCRWHTHVVGCHLHTLQAKLYSSMF